MLILMPERGGRSDRCSCAKMIGAFGSNRRKGRSGRFQLSLKTSCSLTLHTRNIPKTLLFFFLHSPQSRVHRFWSAPHFHISPDSVSIPPSARSVFSASCDFIQTLTCHAACPTTTKQQHTDAADRRPSTWPTSTPSTRSRAPTVRDTLRRQPHLLSADRRKRTSPAALANLQAAMPCLPACPPATTI